MTMTFEGPDAAVRTRPLERVEARIVELAGQIAAATCELLLLVAEFDAANGAGSWGMGSTAQWLSWHCGVGRRAAREQVRVARALRDYPQLVVPFQQGRLSYSKVRAVTRVATEATIDLLIEWALWAPAAQLERITAGWQRSMRKDQVGAQQTARSLSWRWDDDGSLVGSFRLPPEQGIRFLHAMEIAKGVAPKVPDEVAQAEIAAALPDSQLASGSAEPPRESDRILAQEKQAEPHRREQRNSADALIDLLERAIAAIEVHADPDDDGIGLPGLGAERFSLVLRAQQDRLGSGFTTDNGVGLHSEVGLRLTCDCSYSVQTEDAAGNPLHLGRKTRRIRGRLARAVHARDGGTCRAPGCNNRTRQIHHIKHWSHGGLTCIENLISLCDRHHWLVHEGGWSITGPQGNWLFSSPTGKVLGTTPPLTEPVTRLPQNKNVTARAATSLFGPEPFNLSDAIYVLAQRDDFASGSAEPPSWD